MCVKFSSWWQLSIKHTNVRHSIVCTGAVGRGGLLWLIVSCNVDVVLGICQRIYIIQLSVHDSLKYIHHSGSVSGVSLFQSSHSNFASWFSEPVIRNFSLEWHQSTELPPWVACVLLGPITGHYHLQEDLYITTKNFCTWSQCRLTFIHVVCMPMLFHPFECRVGQESGWLGGGQKRPGVTVYSFTSIAVESWEIMVHCLCTSCSCPVGPSSGSLQGEVLHLVLTLLGCLVQRNRLLMNPLFAQVLWAEGDYCDSLWAAMWMLY